VLEVVFGNPFSPHVDGNLRASPHDDGFVLLRGSQRHFLPDAGTTPRGLVESEGRYRLLLTVVPESRIGVRALALRASEPGDSAARSTLGEIRRRDRLGGLPHEHHRAAA
jgi:hypothetical protein